MDEDFQFSPPEMDMSFLNESSGDGLEFTTPSVENTLEEENTFDVPVFENVDVAPVVEDVKEENVSEAVPQFESPEDISFDMPSEFEAPLENVEEIANDGLEISNNEDISFKQDAQDKVANAIREKMSEMQSSVSSDIVENNDEAPSFEPVIDEEIQIFPSTEPYQEESVSKEDIFVEGRNKLKNMIKNESQQSIDIIKNNDLTK